MLGFDFVKPFLTLVFVYLYVMCGVRQFIYEDDFTPKMIIGPVMYIIQMLLYCIGLHILFEAFGHYYVNSEMPRLGNEKLLNGLKEGVFIIDKKEDTLLFQNDSAKTLTKRMLNESGINLFGEKDSVMKSKL